MEVNLKGSVIFLLYNVHFCVVREFIKNSRRKQAQRIVKQCPENKEKR